MVSSNSNPNVWPPSNEFSNYAILTKTAFLMTTNSMSFKFLSLPLALLLARSLSLSLSLNTYTIFMYEGSAVESHTLCLENVFRAPTLFWRLNEVKSNHTSTTTRRGHRERAHTRWFSVASTLLHEEVRLSSLHWDVLVPNQWCEHFSLGDA